MKPKIVINFKNYASGKKVLTLAKIIERIDKNIIIGVPVEDIKYIRMNTDLKIYSQHVDYFESGRNTGYIIPEAIKTDGAVGTFLNHSEHRLRFDVLKKTIARCKKVGLKTLVFSKNLNEAKKIKQLKPDYLVIEPPGLVAGDLSVSEAKPQLIKKVSKELKSKFLVGAGIKSRDDLRAALNFGASGVALSSGFMKSKNPFKFLKDLIS